LNSSLICSSLKWQTSGPSRHTTRQVTSLSIISDTAEQIDKDLGRADRLRQSILKKAFSGQLVKRNARNKDTA
jgi:hypothetical protein